MLHFSTFYPSISLIFYHLTSFSSFGMRYNWNRRASSPFILISVIWQYVFKINTCLFMVLLILSFFFLKSLNNISLYGCIIVYLSIHLLENLFVASGLGCLQYKSYKHSCVGFCVDTSFQLNCT